MSSKDDALRRKKKQEKLSNELLGISNAEFEPKEKKKPQQEQFKKSVIVVIKQVITSLW